MAVLADLPGITALPALVSERLLPVTPALEELLPQHGVQPGSSVLVSSKGAPGATTLALELLVGISVSGSWCAVAGFPELGVVAADERGLELSRLLLVPNLGGPQTWPQVVAALFDAVDAVLLVPPRSVRQSDARRLAARAKDRKSVLVVLDRLESWTAPVDLRCTVSRARWSGLGRGHGILRQCSFEVEVSGRGAAARPRRAPVLLSA